MSMSAEKPPERTTVRVTAKMLRAGGAAVVANRWHPLPINILKSIYLAMEAARAKAS